MSTRTLPIRRAALFLACAAAAVLVVAATPRPAVAWWRGGVFFGGPTFYFGPPVYVAPPLYYAPPPVYYPPPVYAPPPQAAYDPPPGRRCFAGSYICPLDERVQPGASCSCPTGRGSAYGRAG